ncbi:MULTISPECIES: adenosylmethionine decarboxylase [Neobacillus]|uniref:S-adenosylmethionine decarboxylase proenzyme n=1 Tax=Neobacillus rhizophilus TaxID=2833579 RepID=A0A942U8G7_9BACI|nr:MULTISPECIES: adenosylmethionine decarboxylase [Neobacillus]MBS4214487.1 adenosylmethionine decarboxylase [Neobacillus rhizophilus]
MEMKGQHLIVDAYDCRAELLNNADELKTLMLDTLRELELEILLACFHSFSPQGVTGIIAISTSHFSIHTWPEYGYAAFDLYTCSPQDTWPVLRKFLGKIGAGRATAIEIKRGMERQISPIYSKEPHPRFTDSRRPGNAWDMKILKEIKNGGHHILYQGSSELNDILLVEAKDLRLYLNEEFQFSSLDERHYHEALVLPAMELAKSRKRVLILGGGDGLAVREVIKYHDVSHIDLVEIDPMIIKLAANEPAFVDVNEGSLKDNRLKIHTLDAKLYLMGEMNGYDVIIIDFPDPVDTETSLLYTKELFDQVGRHLNTNGIIVCQSSSPADTPRVYWSIAKTLQAAGFKTEAFYSVVPSFGMWGFHIAQRGNFVKKWPQISVHHEAIEANVEPLFHLPPKFHPPKTGLIINSKNNLKLHELYQQEMGNI